MKRLSVAASVLGAALLLLLCVTVLCSDVTVRLTLGVVGALGAAVEIRLLALRAAGVRECASWVLTMVAPLLPRSRAVDYVRELGDSFGDAGMHRRLALDTLLSAPRLVVTEWGSVLRTRVVAVVVRAVHRPVRRCEALLSTAPPLWPATRREFHAARRCWRMLRWCCAVVRVATGHWQHPTLASRAGMLATRCRRIEVQTQHDRASREHSATAVALELQVHHATREFSAALHRFPNDKPPR